MAGRGPAELQRSVADTHTQLIPSYAGCAGSFRVWSLRIPGVFPVIFASRRIFIPSLCTQGTNLWLRLVPLLPPVCGLRPWGVPVSCESRNQTVGPEIGGLLAFPLNYISVVSMSTNRKRTWTVQEVSHFLPEKKSKKAFTHRAAPVVELQVWVLFWWCTSLFNTLSQGS